VGIFCGFADHDWTRAARPAHRFGLPAFVMGYLGRRLPFGVALTSILLFLIFSIVVGSQISS
jgi:hypothetical protein